MSIDALLRGIASLHAPLLSLTMAGARLHHISSAEDHDADVASLLGDQLARLVALLAPFDVCGTLVCFSFCLEEKQLILKIQFFQSHSTFNFVSNRTE